MPAKVARHHREAATAGLLVNHASFGWQASPFNS